MPGRRGGLLENADSHDVEERDLGKVDQDLLRVLLKDLEQALPEGWGSRQVELAVDPQCGTAALSGDVDDRDPQCSTCPGTRQDPGRPKRRG